MYPLPVTRIHRYSLIPWEYTTGNDYKRHMALFEQYEIMCELIICMWIYDEIMFVQLCTTLPMAHSCYHLFIIVFCESNFLVANKLISYLI